MEIIFPGFKADSFIWQISCAQCASFALEMMMGHNKALPLPCALYMMGASWGPSIASGQIWRLLTPVMLHANLTHLLFNIFFQLRMGFGMESQFGKWRFALLYTSCGFIGNLISNLWDPLKLSVGASTAGFGLIGCWIAEILLNWERLGADKSKYAFWVVLMLTSVVSMSAMTPNMDLWGHIGGALGGFLMAIIIADIPEPQRQDWHSYARVAAACALALGIVGGLGKLLFFSSRLPLPDCTWQTLPIAQMMNHAATAATATAAS